MRIPLLLLRDRRLFAKRLWRAVPLFGFLLGIPQLGWAQDVKTSDMNCDFQFSKGHSIDLSRAISLIQEAGFPKDWRVIIACNQKDWERIQHGVTLSPYHARTAFTSLKKRTTAVNLRIFDAVYNGGNPPMSVLHHEVGHIRCQCSNEDEADKQGQSRRPPEH
jgi:hypothetical protein